MTWYLLVHYFCLLGSCMFNLLNAKLNPICHLLALLGAHHILHFSRIRVNIIHAPPCLPQRGRTHVPTYISKRV